MKTFHSLMAGLRPACSILVQHLALTLLFFGAGLALLQPCVAAPLQFELTGSLVLARFGHSATLLPNGTVLVTGHAHGTKDAELYDPATGLWTTTAHMIHYDGFHTATLLRNGKVLVAGGYGSSGLDTHRYAELYDPATGTWTTGFNLLANTSKAFPKLQGETLRTHQLTTRSCSYAELTAVRLLSLP